MYPEVSALAPTEHHDPLEPFIEIVQGSQTCQACLGEYLVEITRSYQQQQKWTWSVQEQEQRIEGLVTSKYHEVKQCPCQEGEMQELVAPLLTLLDLFITQGWQLHFPYHSWFYYLHYLMESAASGREKCWYDPALVREKLLPFADDTNTMEEQRNVMKGTLCYQYNERIGRGCIYALEPPLGLRPLVETCKGTSQELG
jgi:hypothetical protein